MTDTAQVLKKILQFHTRRGRRGAETVTAWISNNNSDEGSLAFTYDGMHLKPGELVFTPKVGSIESEPLAKQAVEHLKKLDIEARVATPGGPNLITNKCVIVNTQQKGFDDKIALLDVYYSNLPGPDQSPSAERSRSR